MSLSTMYEEHLLPTAQDSSQQVATLLICKNFLVRAGITHILAATRFAVSEEAFEDTSTLVALPESSPVLCIIAESDVTSEPAGIVAGLKTQFPSARVVVLADSLEPAALMQAYQAGLSGICSTTMSRDALIKVLELVMLGEAFVPSALAFAMLTQRVHASEARPSLPASFTLTQASAAAASKLSIREAEILRCLMDGASNKLIARDFDVAESTVKVHVKAILRKIGVANRTQAAMWAAGNLSSASDSRLIAPGE